MEKISCLFFEGNEDIFIPIKERLKQSNARIRKHGSDYLAYALMDLIVDYYFVVLEKVDIQLDILRKSFLILLKGTASNGFKKQRGDDHFEKGGLAYARCY